MEINGRHSLFNLNTKDAADNLVYNRVIIGLSNEIIETLDYLVFTKKRQNMRYKERGL